MNVVAKDNKITIQPKDEKLTILNLLHWYRGRSEFYGGEGILQGLDKYKEFLSKQTKPMAELLKSDDYGRNWYIVTRVERIRGNEVKELSSTSVSNEDDRKLEITDNDMKAGDKYRVTKTLFEKNATNIDDKLVELVTTVEADVKKEEPKVEEKPQVTPEQPKSEEKPQTTPSEQPKPEEKIQTTPSEQPKPEEKTQTTPSEQPKPEEPQESPSEQPSKPSVDDKKNSDSSQSPVEQRFNNILPKTGLTENSAGAALLGLLGVVLATLGFRRKR